MHDDNKSRFHEIEETRTSAAQDRFEEILQKVKAAGAHIDRDEESPLYADVAQQEVEIGRRRIVEFSLNHTDFQITRDEKPPASRAPALARNPTAPPWNSSPSPPSISN